MAKIKNLDTALAALSEQYENSGQALNRTDADRTTQAEDEYQSYYNKLRQSAEQSAARNDLALQQQREGLAESYGKQKEASKQEYSKAMSQMDRQLLQRGMQRSSYAGQTLGNIALKGAAAQQEIAEAQTKAEGNIDAQRAQLQGQLADTLAQYDASQASDILARTRQLEEQDYNRGFQERQYQNQLASQMYNAYYQQGRDAVADQQFAQQMAMQASNLELQREQMKTSASQWERSFERQLARDTAEDQRYQDQLAYQRERDTVSDQRYQQQFDYQAGRDAIADQRYQQQWDYQVGRDAASDAFQREQWEYSKGRDAVADARYADETAYARGRDAIGDARYEQQWAYQLSRDAQDDAWKQKQFDYQVGRDAVADARYTDETAYSRGRDAIQDARYDQQYADSRADTRFAQAMQIGSYGLQVAGLGLQAQQQKWQQGMAEKQFTEGVRQYDTSLAEQQRQFDRLHPGKSGSSSGPSAKPDASEAPGPSVPTQSAYGSYTSSEEFLQALTLDFSQLGKTLYAGSWDAGRGTQGKYEPKTPGLERRQTDFAKRQYAINRNYGR